MSKFVIQPHGRLQEAVAHEKGYFSDEGLDYEISGGDIAGREKKVDEAGHVVEIKQGAYESYEAGKGNKGRKSDISCACHWAVNQAAASDVGKSPSVIIRAAISRPFRRWNRSFRGTG